MTETAQLIARLDKMTSAVQALAALMGARLSREQMAERLGVHRNTLTTRLATDPRMPRPGRDGKWLLSEVVDWEQRQ